MLIETVQSDFSDHFGSRYHCGTPVSWTHQGSISSSTCGDEVVFYAVIDGTQIREAWHTVRGCIVCQAASSFVCKWAVNKSADDLVSIGEDGFLAILGPLTPLRQQCALLPFRCLKRLLLSAAERH